MKPQMRAFLKQIRQGLTQLAKAGGLEGTLDQVAFLHADVVGQGNLQLARDNEPSLFVSRAGARLSHRAVQQRIQMWAKRQGIDRHMPGVGEQR